MSLDANRQAVKWATGPTMGCKIGVELVGTGNCTLGEKLIDAIGLYR